ncbi:MAG: type II secretion system protein [Planctomycetota bacterium]
MTRRGFTLLEMCIVLAVVALATTLAVVSLRGVHQKIRGENVQQLIRGFDAKGRRWAHTRGQAVDLVFDINAQTLGVHSQNPDEPPVPLEPVRLPLGFELVAVITARGESTAREVRLPCSPLGTTPSYAVRFKPADGPPRELLFAGLTGNTHEVRDPQQSQQVFERLRQTGLDPD